MTLFSMFVRTESHCGNCFLLAFVWFFDFYANGVRFQSPGLPRYAAHPGNISDSRRKPQRAFTFVLLLHDNNRSFNHNLPIAFVQPRCGNCGYGILWRYPGSAATPRPWVLECNAFGVKSPREMRFSSMSSNIPNDW
jgi:hypothetical protein